MNCEGGSRAAKSSRYAFKIVYRRVYSYKVYRYKTEATATSERLPSLLFYTWLLPSFS